MEKFGAEIEARKKKLGKYLKRKGYASAVFLKETLETIPGNYYYYGGRLTSEEYSAIIIGTNGYSIAIVSEYSVEKAQNSGLYDKVYPVRQSFEELTNTVVTLAKKHFEGKIVFDPSTICSYVSSAIESKGLINSISLTDFVYRQRSVKSEYEISQMEKAIEITWNATENTASRIKEGIKASDIVKIFMKNIGEKGVTPSFPVDVRIRHGVDENEKESVIPDSFVTLDVGIRLETGYLSDFGRTLLYKPRKESLEIAKIAYEIKREGLKFFKPGMRGNEVKRKIDATIEEFGFVSTHRPGHQIGLNVHEPYGPNLSEGKENERRLDSGNVVTWEPGIGLAKYGKSKRFGFAHIEDIVLIAQNPILLGNKPFELIY
jgi:Xaa-Pro aminopeptidase